MFGAPTVGDVRSADGEDLVNALRSMSDDLFGICGGLVVMDVAFSNAMERTSWKEPKMLWRVTNVGLVVF